MSTPKHNHLPKSSQQVFTAGYFDNCPICQMMKKEGITMTWVPDDKGEELFEEGFNVAKISEKQAQKIKRAVPRDKSKT